jgi:hypothetical protein
MSSKRPSTENKRKFVSIKRTKSERTKPNRPRKKPYRGQGKVR